MTPSQKVWLYYYSDGNYKKQRKKGFTVSIEPYLKAYGKKQLLYLFKKAEIFDLIEDVYITGILDGFYNGEDRARELIENLSGENHEIFL